MVRALPRRPGAGFYLLQLTLDAHIVLSCNARHLSASSQALRSRFPVVPVSLCHVWSSNCSRRFFCVRPSAANASLAGCCIVLYHASRLFEAWVKGKVIGNDVLKPPLTCIWALVTEVSLTQGPVWLFIQVCMLSNSLAGKPRTGHWQDVSPLRLGANMELLYLPTPYVMRACLSNVLMYRKDLKLCMLFFNSVPRYN